MNATIHFDDVTVTRGLEWAGPTKTVADILPDTPVEDWRANLAPDFVHGEVTVAGHTAKGGNLVHLADDGDAVGIEASSDATACSAMPIRSVNRS